MTTFVANDTLRLLAPEFKVLGQGTDDSALMDLVLLTHARTIHDTHKGKEDATITNLHVVLNIDEREYLTIIADFRLWRYFGLWTNVVHFIHSFLGVRREGVRS